MRVAALNTFSDGLICIILLENVLINPVFHPGTYTAGGGDYQSKLSSGGGDSESANASPISGSSQNPLDLLVPGQPIEFPLASRISGQRGEMAPEPPVDSQAANEVYDQREQVFQLPGPEGQISYSYNSNEDPNLSVVDEATDPSGGGRNMGAESGSEGGQTKGGLMTNTDWWCNQVKY